jgi:hypothetical protein
MLDLIVFHWKKLVNKRIYAVKPELVILENQFTQVQAF